MKQFALHRQMYTNAAIFSKGITSFTPQVHPYKLSKSSLDEKKKYRHLILILLDTIKYREKLTA